MYEVPPDGSGVSVGCFIIMENRFSSCARLAAQERRLFLLVDLFGMWDSWVFPSLQGFNSPKKGYLTHTWSQKLRPLIFEGQLAPQKQGD